MSNDITRAQDNALQTWDGKRVRTSKEDLLKALAPMFVAFPGLEMSDETFNAYYMMLADLDPNKLAVAILRACQAHEYPTHLITVAAIRKAYDGERQAPGPRNDVDPAKLKAIPTEMFRLDPEEDRRQRMARLRMTKNWDKYYA